MADQLSIKNHFLPQFYLKNFAGQDGKIRVYNLLVPHEEFPMWKKESPAGFGYHEHLYNYHSNHIGRVTDEFENWLNREIEKPASEVVRKVVKNRQLTANDWTILKRFAIALDQRTPSSLLKHLEEQQRKIPQLLNEEIELIKRNGFRKVEKAGANISESSLNLKFPLEVKRTPVSDDKNELSLEMSNGRALWLHGLKYLLDYSYEKILQYRWTILRPAKGLRWFTSDCPVIRLNYYKHGNYDFNGGFGNKRSNIILPLSPEHLLFTQIGDKQILKGTKLSEKKTQELKSIIASHANLHVISDVEDYRLPYDKKREVNCQKFQENKKFWKDWHTKNIELEKHL